DRADLAVGEYLFAINLRRVHGCLAAIGGGTHRGLPLVIVSESQMATLAVCRAAWESCYDTALGTLGHNSQGPRVDHPPRHCPVRAGPVLAASPAGPISLAGYPGPRPRHPPGESAAGGAVHARRLRLPDPVRRACCAFCRRARTLSPHCLDIVHGLR